MSLGISRLVDGLGESIGHHILGARVTDSHLVAQVEMSRMKVKPPVKVDSAFRGSRWLQPPASAPGREGTSRGGISCIRDHIACGRLLSMMHTVGAVNVAPANTHTCESNSASLSIITIPYTSTSHACMNEDAEAQTNFRSAGCAIERIPERF